jgi:hypothetical protein
MALWGYFKTRINLVPFHISGQMVTELKRDPLAPSLDCDGNVIR